MNHHNITEVLLKVALNTISLNLYPMLPLQLMKQMSSTDTPLGTLNMLKEKQKSEKSAYILLSGNKGLTG
jgi:U4/U6.U5 tri-snRNP-associated protein 1